MRIADIIKADSKTIIGGCPICNGFAKLWELIGYPIYVKTMRNSIKMLNRELNPDNLLMHCTKYKQSYPFRKIKDYCFVPAGNMVLCQTTTKEETFTAEEQAMLAKHIHKFKPYLESINPIKFSDPSGFVSGAMYIVMENALREIERHEDVYFRNFVLNNLRHSASEQATAQATAANTQAATQALHQISANHFLSQEVMPTLFRRNEPHPQRMSLGEVIATEQVIREGGEIGRIHT